MEKTETPQRSGGIFNYFQGATIHNMVINGNMAKSGTDHYYQGIHQTKSDITYSEGGNATDNASANNKELNKELMARAIENCQEYIWANSAYAVLFCIIRDDYKQKDMPMTTYERMVELLPYKTTRKHTCPAGTIANAFSDNNIFYSPTDKWDELNASPRIIKLRDALRKELKL